MHGASAATYDLGAMVGRLRGFGPPEVVPLDDFAGNGNASEAVTGFWEEVLAVSFVLTADANVATRLPRLSFLADEAVPYAQIIAPFGRAAAGASRFTFAVDVEQAGSLSAASILAPLPRLLLLPGWGVLVDVLAGVAGDAITGGRVCRQRYRVVDVEG